ncbi:MAG: methyltransferase domain-containing protein [Rhodopseudomonas palustris]|uniref:Methyltransferase domain-containing protein n=1 Tax=Rhodopseudomonas palustris TaxID=1076 RepID=A0A933RUA3_RHOPL|nr:methyltransferase domain-containing protein [Rhodopseudomonas palustris]
MKLEYSSHVKMLRYIARTAKNMFGVFPRKCNLCGFSGSFHAFGTPPRFDAKCPHCGSLERHRLFGLWLEQNTSLIAGRQLLHFAPEGILTQILKPLAAHYQTADLNPESADIVLNIEHIDLPDNSIDAILCSHVLEHVNYRQALSELRRVLRPNGDLLLLFPIVEGWDDTYSNDTITTPKDRELHFGQCDHSQLFGRHIRQDIRMAGFTVDEFTATEPDVSTYGLIRGEKLFIAHRQS